MGKGDQRSKRGKIHRGTWGKRRPRPKTHKRVGADAAAGEAADAAPTTKGKEPKVVKKQPKE